MKLGFTILEVVAATVVLGLLAVAVVPLTSTLVSDHDRLHNTLAARAWFAAPEQALINYVHDGSGIIPLQDHPGWYIHVQILTPTMPPPSAGMVVTRPSYRWARLDVATQATPGHGIIASRLILVPSAP